MGGCESGYESLQRCRSPLPFGIGLPGGRRFVPGVPGRSGPAQFWAVRTLSGQCNQGDRSVADFLCRPSMNTNGLALNRFRSEVLAHAGEIETALALGAAPEHTVASYAESSIHASLIPAIDNLRSLGIVWIPGLMTGMLLSGADPLYAAIYQFVVIAMILASSGLTSLLSTMMIRNHAFSAAEQLVLKSSG